MNKNQSMCDYYEENPITTGKFSAIYAEGKRTLDPDDVMHVALIGGLLKTVDKYDHIHSLGFILDEKGFIFKIRYTDLSIGIYKLPIPLELEVMIESTSMDTPEVLYFHIMDLYGLQDARRGIIHDANEYEAHRTSVAKLNEAILNNSGRSPYDAIVIPEAKVKYRVKEPSYYKV